MQHIFDVNPESHPDESFIILTTYQVYIDSIKQEIIINSGGNQSKICLIDKFCLTPDKLRQLADELEEFTENERKTYYKG